MATAVNIKAFLMQEQGDCSPLTIEFSPVFTLIFWVGGGGGGPWPRPPWIQPWWGLLLLPNYLMDVLHADINECLDVNNCGPNAACTYSNGNFSCTCVQGYSGDGFVCIGKSSTSYQSAWWFR